MYPSNKDKTYGTFVRMFKEGIEENCCDIHFDSCFIKGRAHNKMVKLCVYVMFYCKIAFKILFHKYDIVYNHQITHTAPVLRVCRYFKKFRLVMNIHGSDVVTITKLSAVLLEIAKPLLRSCELIVVPSEYFKTVVIEKIKGIAPDKFFVSASGGVDKKIFYPKSERKLSNRIVYVSRIDEGKGWLTLLKALAMLNSKGELVNKRCDFYGIGNQVSTLVAAIIELGLSNICVYHGPKTHDELSEIFNTCDVMVFPTELNESLGLVGLEAMACGCPVIGSNIGCLPEFIRPGYNGWLFTPCDVEALAKAISDFYLCYDKEIYRLSKNSLKMADSYEKNNVAKKIAARLLRLE